MTAHHETTTIGRKCQHCDAPASGVRSSEGLCDRHSFPGDRPIDHATEIEAGLLRRESEGSVTPEAAVTGSIICSVRGRLVVGPASMPAGAGEVVGRSHPFYLDQSFGGRPHLSPLPFLIAPILTARTEHRLRVALARGFAQNHVAGALGGGADSVELFGWAEGVAGAGLVFYAVRALDAAGAPL